MPQEDTPQTVIAGKSVEEWRKLLCALLELQEKKPGDTEKAVDTIELDQQRVGRLSRMDALQAKAMTEAIAARRRHQSVVISAAIKRIDEGEFGYCKICGDEIARKRLELDPTLAVCSQCAC